MPKDVAIVLCNGSVNSAVAATLAAQRYRLVMLYCEVGDVDGGGAGGTGKDGAATGGGTSGSAAQAKGGPAIQNPAEQGGATGVSGPGRRRSYERLVEFLKPFREHTVSMPALPTHGRARFGHSGIDPRQLPDLAHHLLGLLPVVSIGARYAAHYDAAAVSLGLRVGPDGGDLARATEYLQILNELIQLPCGQRDTELQMPLLELEPWQVIDLGVQIGCPMDRTWSCLKSGATPCGTCLGCIARDAAFEQAGRADPLKSDSPTRRVS